MDVKILQWEGMKKSKSLQREAMKGSNNSANGSN